MRSSPHSGGRRPRSIRNPPCSTRRPSRADRASAGLTGARASLSRGLVNGESSRGRVQISTKPFVESAQLVTEKAEELIVEATLLITLVRDALVAHERGAASLARHVFVVGEEGEHDVDERTGSIGRHARVSNPTIVGGLPRNSPPRAAGLYVLAIVGTTPSCCIIPRVSQFVQDSAIWPPSDRSIEVPVTVTSLPVADMPQRSPLCVPRAVQRVTTLSPSSIWSSIVIRTSGNAVL